MVWSLVSLILVDNIASFRLASLASWLSWALLLYLDVFIWHIHAVVYTSQVAWLRVDNKMTALFVLLLEFLLGCDILDCNFLVFIPLWGLRLRVHRVIFNLQFAVWVVPGCNFEFHIREAGLLYFDSSDNLHDPLVSNLELVGFGDDLFSLGQ